MNFRSLLRLVLLARTMDRRSALPPAVATQHSVLIIIISTLTMVEMIAGIVLAVVSCGYTVIDISLIGIRERRELTKHGPRRVLIAIVGIAMTRVI